MFSDLLLKNSSSDITRMSGIIETKSPKLLWCLVADSAASQVVVDWPQRQHLSAGSGEGSPVLGLLGQVHQGMASFRFQVSGSYQRTHRRSERTCRGHRESLPLQRLRRHDNQSFLETQGEQQTCLNRMSGRPKVTCKCTGPQSRWLIPLLRTLR